MAMIERRIGLGSPAQAFPPPPDRSQKGKYGQQKGDGIGKGGDLREGSAADHHKKQA
jgi:hypothetical protein